MFEQFPKKRIPLPKAYEDIFSDYWKINRGGKTFVLSLSKRMESWMHKQVAKDLLIDKGEQSTLEIGAGSLNQLQYEAAVGPYDIVEPSVLVGDESPLLRRIRNTYSDISEINHAQKYDRITSIASFEHICNLPSVIAKTGILLSPNGELRVAIPSEGTPLWALSYRITTGLEFRIKYGLDYSVLMRYVHVNTAIEIEELLRFFYDCVKVKFFGISKYISFYQFFECRSPVIENCKNYLDRE
ncbi:MAG: class I SAM-dependent methyltransferase [Candidatus Omnitrophota bacterium]